MHIDLNSDLGEGFGPYKHGDDEAMLRLVSSANVACGGHAGDPDLMSHTFSLCKSLGVAAGAHPGFPDLFGFGRRRIPCSVVQVENLVAYQIGAAQAVARLAGCSLNHVKAHGALGNWISEDESVARAFARAVRAVDPLLTILAIAATAGERGAELEGARFVREIYADRAYTDEGLLVPRDQPGSVLHDPEQIAERVLVMLAEKAVISTSGKRVPTAIDTVCIHGDTPNAVGIAKVLRAKLEQEGIIVQPFAGPERAGTVS